MPAAAIGVFGGTAQNDVLASRAGSVAERRRQADRQRVAARGDARDVLGPPGLVGADADDVAHVPGRRAGLGLRVQPALDRAAERRRRHRRAGRRREAEARAQRGTCRCARRR